MFVAPRVESGDEGKAVVALLPQVIGLVQTATGCGTLRRANGIAVQVMVGDPVCLGDVIETAADGRIGIRFIDGTVFNLSDGTRVVLNEFVCDANGTSHSALFGVSRGNFAFIAGQMAEAGWLTVETPVGSIRGRTRGGGIGMLSLAALTFSIMQEVQAADSNVTFLDDDSITYKDLPHGVFELVTKEAIPRHIIVEDPGETIVLSKIGSSISVNQVANTATRMEELQAAQQDVLANFAKGLGAHGSSTPPVVNPLPVQPINFIQIDTPAAHDPLGPIPFSSPVVPEINIVRLPPTLTVGSAEAGTEVFENFPATSGTFAATSFNSGATLTFGISGGAAGNTVLGGVTYDVSKTDPYGTLYVNSTTGAYSFVPDTGAIDALTAPTTESFMITVSDGTLSANRPFTITINGDNDAGVISGTTTGSVIEAGGASPGTPTATGTLIDTDVDSTPNIFTTVSSPTASAGGYGTFTMTAAGVWTYTLNDANSAVRALDVGDKLTDTFTVTTVDGTAQVVTITINGTDDAAIITGTTTGSVIEASDDSPGRPTATGTLTDADIDKTPDTFTPVSSPRASDAGYGTFTMTAAGVWTYTLNDANSAVRALDADDTLTDTFTVTNIDSTAQVVTITIHGTDDDDDDEHISGATAGSAIEANRGRPGASTATATLTDPNADNPPDTFTPVSSPRASDAGYGTFTMKAAGVRTYTLNDADSAVQALNACIVGGFGADCLIGSNGNDHFVHLSEADSSAARFNTVFDFRSGSDKIDLTAFGALSFVNSPLTSTSNSVPAHTIAWFHDGATNQTIVYVNPTGQVLGIGDSGLLEVHLRGAATIHASDFVSAPTTESVVVAGEPMDPGLAATAENDGAFTGFGEVRTYSTEYTYDNAVVSPAGEHSIAQQRVHGSAPMESGTIHDSGITALDAADDRAGLRFIERGVTRPDWNDEHHTEAILTNAGSINAAGTHVQTIDTDPYIVLNSGVPGAPGSGWLTVANPIANSHALWTDGGDQTISAELKAAGTQGLADSFHFNFAEVNDTPASIGDHENSAGTRGPPAISEEAKTIELSLLELHSADNFTIVLDHAVVTVATHVQHDLIV